MTPIIFWFSDPQTIEISHKQIFKTYIYDILFFFKFIIKECLIICITLLIYNSFRLTLYLAYSRGNLVLRHIFSNFRDVEWQKSTTCFVLRVQENETLKSFPLLGIESTTIKFDYCQLLNPTKTQIKQN